jgi:uncharacterized membrane protein YfhO
MGLGWIALEVHPFGTRQLLVTDFWHQYYPFLCIMQEKLKHGETLLYTWQSGLGTNFIAMMSYYTASPLNFLTLLVPSSMLRDAVTLFLLIKIGAAGGFFALFLRDTFGRNDSSLCVFATMYALCDYIMGYYWNIMWMDTVALLPLVISGVVKLVRTGSYRPYIFSLALALLSNFYIGFFVCVFTAIAYVCICLFSSLRFGMFLRRSGNMLLSTGAGLAISSILLLPTYYALQKTYSINNSFPGTTTFYTTWKKLLSQCLGYQTPTVKEGLPNLYCGILGLVLIGMFLRSMKIRWREKISAILVLSFLLLSCNWNILNFIWHGFHFPNMLPYRFSFLFSFCLVTVAYRAYLLILEQKMKWLDLLAMAGLTIVFLILTYATDRKQAVLFTAMTALAYWILMLLKQIGFLPKRLFSMGILIVLLVEMGCHVRIGTEAVSTSDYLSYPEKYTQTEALLSYIEEQETELGGRTELTSWYTLNDPALYGYDGVSQFSSMANCNVTTFLKKLGLPASEAGNRYYYAHSTPFLDMLLGVRYVIQKTGTMPETETVTEIATCDGVSSYRNKYALPIGFFVNAQVTDFSLDTTKDATSNPFEVQNALFAKMTGITEPLYTAVEVTNEEHAGLDVKRNAYGHYTYFQSRDASEVYLKYDFTAEQDTLLYGYFSVDSTNDIEIDQNGHYAFSQKGSKQPYVFSMGSYQAGEQASLKCDLDADNLKNGIAIVYVYALNQDVLEQGYEMLSAGGLQITSQSDYKLTGTLQAEQDGICYLSIPMDNGWKITVDGVETEPVAIGDAMMGIPVSAGTHTISMRYCPDGLRIGVILCGGTIWALTGLYVIEKKKKRACRRRWTGKRRHSCGL